MDIKIILLTFVLVEAVTLFGRFALKLKSREIFIGFMKRFKLKKMFHFHHMFFGAILALFGVYFPGFYLIEVGIGLVLSDMFHHFVVLKLITGESEFHVLYKNTKFYKLEHKLEMEAHRVWKHLVHFR